MEIYGSSFLRVSTMSRVLQLSMLIDPLLFTSTPSPRLFTCGNSPNKIGFSTLVPSSQMFTKPNTLHTDHLGMAMDRIGVKSEGSKPETWFGQDAPNPNHALEEFSVATPNPNPFAARVIHA
ncbi:hypothetical protein ACOSP7_023431 [Xanthoceras sorbifolium]